MAVEVATNPDPKPPELTRTSPPARPRGSVKQRAAVLFFCFVFGPLIAVGVFIQNSVWCQNKVRDAILPPVQNALYSQVTIGSLKIRIFSLQPRIELYDVTLRPKSPGPRQEFKEPTFRVDSVKVVFRPLQLMARRIDIDRIELDHPHLDADLVDGRIHGLPLPLVDSVDYEGHTVDEPSAFQLRLDAFLVKNGTLHFSADEPDVQVGLIRIKALGTIESDKSLVVDVEAEGRRMHIRMGDADLEEPVNAIRGQLVVTGPKVEIKFAHAEIGPVVAEGNGVVMLKKGPTDIDFPTVHITTPLTLIEDFANKTPPMMGNLEYSGSFSLKGKNIRARGNAKIDDFWLDRFHLGVADADVEMAGTRAVSKRLQLREAGGLIQGTAEMAWPNGDLRLKADASVAGVSFAQLLDAVGVGGSHVDARVDGRVAFDGPINEDFDIKGTADLQQSAFAWTTLGWDEPGERKYNLRVPSGTVAGKFEVKKTGMHFTDVSAVAGSSKLRLDGDMFFRGAADLSFSAAPVDLGEISPVGSVSLSGSGPAKGRVHGDFDALVIDTDLDLDGVKVGSFDFGRGKGPVTFANLTLSSEGTSFTRGQSTYAGPWSIDFHDPITLTASADTKDARIEDLADILWGDMPASHYVHGGPVAGHIDLKGPFDSLTGGYRVTGSQVTVKGETFKTLSATGRWKQGTIWLDDLLARKPAGAEVYARGNLEPVRPGEEALGGRVNLEAHTSKMSLSDLDVVGRDAALVSEMTLRMHIGGNFSRPDVRGRLDLAGTRFHGAPLGASQIDFVTSEDPATHLRDLMTLEGTLAGGSVKSKGQVHLWQKQNLPYEAVLDVSRHSIKPYLYVVNERLVKDDELNAFASGRLKVTGNAFDIGTSEVDAHIDALKLTRGPHELSNKDPIEMSFGNGKVDVRSFSLTGDETRFSLKGTEDADGNLNFAANGELDLAFAELGTDIFTRVEGVLRIPSLRIDGTAGDPIISGIAEVENAAFKTRFFPQAVEDVRGRIKFSQDEVIFERSITGKFGGGGFEAEGALKLKGAAVRYWDLTARFNDSVIRFPAHSLYAKVTGRVDFSGPSSQPLMSGDLRMNELRYTESFDWKAKAISFQKSHDVLTAPDESAKLFGLDIKLSAPDNMVVKNELANIEFRTVAGDPLEIVGNSAQWGILGAIEAVRGGHAPNKATFQDHTFDVQSARLDFVAKDAIDFLYDVSVETVIKDWTVHGRVNGRFSGNSTYQFDSNPPLAAEDINLLLVAGYTRQEAGDKDPAIVAGILASVAGQGLANQRGLGKLKSFIPLDSYEFVPTTVNGQVGLKFVGKKQLTPKLDLQGSFGNTGKGNVQVDYRINKTLHIQGGWSNDERRIGVDNGNPVNAQGDLGADAKFRFEWK